MSTRPLRPPRPNDRRGFEIAIICALPLEADAVEALFDYHWDDDGHPSGKAVGDPNAYSTGAIGCHNVVLAYMPGMGKAHAAAVASNCGKSFPSIRLALVVGICGVIPFKPNRDEILLGDVIISNGIIQYDFGRQLPDRFVRKDTLLDSLGRPNQEIRAVLAKLGSLRNHRQLSAKMANYLDVLRQEPELRAEYPGTLGDRLFEASYRHTEEQKSCEQLGCNGVLIPRRRLQMSETNPTPAVHFGLIATGDSIMKSGEDGDRIAMEEGVIAFEMEGAGVWDAFPTIVIKGACDYADSHKSKVWQRYAAATAAACAKAFLNFWVPSLDQATNFESSLSLQTQGYPEQRKAAYVINEPEKQPVFEVPFSKNDLFVGRDDVLTRLQGLLFEEGRQKVALVGLGGIGKTQIALQLAYWVKKNKRDYSVFWVPALSLASFEQACMRITEACGIQLADGENVNESVRQYLSLKRAGKWLLVVDNADDTQTVMGSAGVEDGIYRFLPKNGEGRILFTTRNRKLAVSVAGRNILEVPAMTRDESRSYLKNALIQEKPLEDGQAVDDLVELLTYLPLALTQAAAYLNENQISITEYIYLFNNTDRDKTELMSAEFHDDTRYEQSQDPVATTWFISFLQIRKADELALRILTYLSCIEPKVVPQSMLPKGQSRQQLTRAIGTLCAYGFLSRRGSSEIFDMHSLVHMATESWVTKHGSQEQQRQTAIAHLAEVFPTDDWENREVWRQYLPHAIKLLGTSKVGQSREVCELGYWVGRCLLDDGRVAEAMEALTDVVAIREITLAESHPDRLASQHELAKAYQADGQIKKAVKLLEHVVLIEETTLEESHLDRLASQQVLAGAYQADGQIKKAVEMLERVIAIRKKIQADDHPHRLTSQHVLAIAYYADGQIKKAVELLERVVSIRETTLEESHPDRLASQQVLAVVYKADGQIQKAIELLERVISVEETTLQESHPDRLASQHELAGAYKADGQIQKAIELLEHVVSVRETTLQESHPSRLASQQVLAVAYQADGRIKKAIELLEHVVLIQEIILQENHPDRLASQHELAGAYYADGQVQKAIELLERVASIQETTLQGNHPDRLASQHGLAMAYHADGQIKKAIELLEHVVATEAETLAEDDPSRQVSKDLATLG
ncbi:kinesin light chain [Fusarium beomiforme]|uniref:Kinesin light chain n=1 Tax=Fusarium beomiforme TaxID=44412 RepID=A0A9P5AF78_9HYPO|nr:kinesin light chain [Fusarium beomiforme]